MSKPCSSTNVLLLTMSLCLSLTSQVRADQAPPFPADPNAWINSGPLSLSGLKGKGVVLWFFEEEDSGSAARWQANVEAVRKYEGRPVIIIAVNSGNPRQRVEAYVRQVKGQWPVLVDTFRDFEKACGIFSEVNSKNVSMFRFIKPDGQIETGVTDEIKDIAEKAVEGAEWKIDPINIPDPLKPAWFAVEIGNYKGLGMTLKKSTSSPKAEIKEAATKLMDLIQQEIDAQMAKIKEAQEGSNPYKTHELLSEMFDRFNGFELPKETATLKKDLAKDAKVKAGTLAAKSLELERKKLAIGNPAMKAKSITALEKIVADFPDTTLAQQAQTLIEFAK